MPVAFDDLIPVAGEKKSLSFDDLIPANAAGASDAQPTFNTPVPFNRVAEFEQWAKQLAPPQDSGDYDYGGAFLAGEQPDTSGHWTDRFKKPNHPTFSNESIYAKDAPLKAGYWNGDKFIPPPAEIQAAEEQQAMERNAGATKTFADVKDTLRDMTNFPGKVAYSAAMIPGIGTSNFHWPTHEEVEKPLLPPEAMKLATLGVAGPAIDFAARAFPNNTPVQYAKGATDSIADAASGFTSPANLALLGLAPEGKLAQRIVMGTFEGQALGGLPEQFDALKQAKTPAEKGRIIASMIIGPTVPIAGALAHSRAGEVPKPKPDLGIKEAAPEVVRPQGQNELSKTPATPLEPTIAAERSANADVQNAVAPDSIVPESQPEITTPIVEPSTVRLYHGATKGSGQAGRDFTTDLQYAQGYADKAVGGGEVWYVDVPKGVLKTHDEYGQPMTRVIVPDEIANKAKLLEAPSVQAGTENQGQASGKQQEDFGVKEAPPVPVEAQGQMEPTPTSTKNAVTDQERIARDIAPAVEAAKRDFGTVWDEAEAEAKADPDISKRLAESVAAEPRALSDKENAHLLRRQIEVQNEHDAAIKAVNEAPDQTARADASVRLERARDDLQTVYDAAKSAGTETGRGLNARKMLANNDYSLAKMEATTRAVVNNGKALTERQAADVKGLHDRIRAAEEKLSAYEARDQFKTELRKAKAEARKTGFKPQSFLEQQAQRARERIISRRGKLHADPIGITQVAHLADEAIIGASHIARGVTKFADWSAQMIADFGERIKPHLQALFAKAREIHANTARNASQPLSGRSDMLSRTAAGESPFERAVGGDKKRIQSRIEQIQEKTAAGDFTKPEKRPPRMDAKKAALLFEYQKAKEAYNKKLLQAKLDQQSVPRKALRYGGEMLNTTRALMTSFDLSAVLRQGGFIAFGHPLRALQAFPDMIRALRSEQSQFRVMEDIRNRPNAPLYQQSKLYISDQGPGVSLSKMEEQYMSRWARHIPGVGASERAYTTFLNRLRADSFDTMAENLGRRGKVTLDEAKAIANFVNVATGRGNLDAAAKAATGLNTIFFAPRYVVSRFQLLAGQPLMRGNFRTRQLIAKEYARTLAGAAVVYALGQASGATVSTDPTSTDFLKLKFGNTRVDPLFGLTQASVFLSREGVALKRFLTQDQSKQPQYGSGGEVLGRFLRTKLAPAIGAGVDVLSGKNVVGQKVTPATVGKELLVPLSFGDVYNAMKDQGIAKGTALGILAIFGMGVQNYQAKSAPLRSREARPPRSLNQAMEERRLETMARDLRAA